MNFEINPLAYKKIIAVPSAIVEENIRLASSIQLKVILYLIAKADDDTLDSNKIAKALFASKEDVDDALVFWCERGILKSKDNDEAVTVVTLEKSVQEDVPVAITKSEEQPDTTKRVADIPISRPSHEQVAARLEECKEFCDLFAEAQLALGKTIGYDGQSVLIMMHDSYGLPFEVILMAVEYAVSQNKTGFSSIAKIGRIWHENEIDTLEGAMEYIEEHNVINETWNKLRTLTDITNRTPTQKQRGYLVAWIKEYGYNADMIYYAYEESIDRTGKMSMPYMDKIIKNWHENGVKTPADIQKAKAKWEAQRPQKQNSANKKPAEAKVETSYDLDAYTKKAIGLKYKKKTSE